MIELNPYMVKETEINNKNYVFTVSQIPQDSE